MGPYASMFIDGHVNLANFRLMDVAYGTVVGPLTALVPEEALVFHGLTGQKGHTTYHADGRLDLSHEPTLAVKLDVERGGRLEDLLDALDGLHPAVASVRESLRGEIYGAAEIHGPARRLAATAQLQLPRFTVFERAFRNGALTGRLENGHDFHIDAFRAEEAEGELKAHGTVTLDGDLAMAYEGRGLALERLLWTEGEPEARARVTVNGRVDGRLDAPRPSGDLVLEDLSVFDVPLGTARGAVVTHGRVVRLEGTAGDEVQLRASAELVGQGPYQAHFEGSTRHLERYLASRFDEPVSGELTGVLDLAGQLLAPAQSKGAFAISRLVVTEQRLRLENSAPFQLGFDSGALSLDPVLLRTSSGSVSLGGTLSGQGVLDATLAGELDAHALDGLIPRFDRLSGRVSFQASVHGPSEAPGIVGNLSLARGGFSWIGLPLNFSRVEGSAAFSQHTVILSELHGELNGGAVEIGGDVQLRGFTFGHYNLSSTLKGVNLRIPESIPSVVNGTLALAGDPERDLRLTGTLDVLSAHYTRDFNLETLIDSFGEAKAEAAQAEDDSGAPLQFDVLLRGGNDLRVDNDLAHLKLEGDLRLRGTSAALGLMGTVTSTNGLVDFRGYRYHVSQASFTFTEPDSIAATFDVNADTDAREHRVFVHVYGTPASYRLQLTSQPWLSEEDILKLLTIGVTSQDNVAGTNAVGAAGYVGDVLWNISGLHDQVARLLPRNSLLRSLDVSPGSAFIEGTGQVEPVMRIEARVLTDQLKLSAQLPLAASTGIRIAAEYQLDEHLSLQGAWDNDYTDYYVGNPGLGLRARWDFGD